MCCEELKEMKKTFSEQVGEIGGVSLREDTWNRFVPQIKQTVKRCSKAFKLTKRKLNSECTIAWL